MLPITGHVQTTLVDFPEKIATLFFFSGCNLRCPYCHNSSLFEVPPQEKWLSRDYIISDIQKRLKFIEGVSFSGGETSLYDELIDLVREIKERFGLAVKIDSNGLKPEFIEKILPDLSYIAIDIKTTPDLYCELGCKLPKKEVEEKLFATKKLLENQSNAKVEYRTTMYPKLVESYERLCKMADFIPENAVYYLQKFIKDNAYTDEAKAAESYSTEQLERMAVEMRRITKRDKIFVRTYL